MRPGGRTGTPTACGRPASTVYLQPFRGLSRVKVGPFDSRSQAEETLASLESQGFEGIVTPAGPAR